MNTRLNPKLVFMLMTAGSSLFYDLVFTVNMVYQVTIVGLNPLQLVLVGTTLEVTAMLFEIPTGIVADLYSRKLSIVIGFVVIGVGFLVEGSIPQFWAILLAQVLWGIGYTFTSGAREAWLADEIGETEANPLYLRASQVAMLAGLLGIGISTAIGIVSLQLPIQIGGAFFIVLSLFVWIAMPETGFTPTPAEERTSWQQMGHTAGEAVRLVRISPALMTVMALSLVYGLYSEGMDRLWTPHLLDNFSLPTYGALEPIVWFGLISAAGMLLSIGAVEIVRRSVDTNSPSAGADGALDHLRCYGAGHDWLCTGPELPDGAGGAADGAHHAQRRRSAFHGMDQPKRGKPGARDGVLCLRTAQRRRPNDRWTCCRRDRYDLRLAPGAHDRRPHPIAYAVDLPALAQTAERITSDAGPI